jgi:hypothetical protein
MPLVLRDRVAKGLAAQAQASRQSQSRREEMTNIYADRLATVMARFMTAGDAAKLVEPVEVVDEREATFTLQAPDNRVFQISVMDVTDDI